MRRRDFITLVGGAAAVPLAARAQQRERVRRIGVLMSAAAEDPEGQARIAAFRQGFQTLGWTEGKTYKSTSAGPEAMATSIANSRRNWSRSHRTSSWPPRARLWRR